MTSKIVTLIAAAATAFVLASAPAAAQSDDVLSRDAVLRDPEIPAAGNPDGDVTIVEYFDFQCSYCKRTYADLVTLLREDDKLRIVFKDWPILGETSEVASKLVLAAKYQGKFVEAHNAVMQHRGRLTAANLPAILAGAGVDAGKAARDQKTNAKAIDAILARNNAQAEAFGFNGTPSFIVGTFRVPGVLDIDNFRQAIKDARAMQEKTNGGRGSDTPAKP